MADAFGGFYPTRWSRAASRVDYDARWRREDLEQRDLDNARKIWDKHAEDNRQAVDEHAEYVRSMATLSAFMSGFVNVAFVQFNFDPSQVSYAVLMGFGITNSLTMALTVCCMAICTLVLASIFRTFTDLLSEDEEAAFLMGCRDFAHGYRPGSRPPAPRRNFRAHWHFFCRAEWLRAVLMFSGGIALFILNTGFGAFIKFNRYHTAAGVLAGGLGPGLLGVAYFHARWMPYLLDTRVSRTADLEGAKAAIGMPFDWHLPGAKGWKASPGPRAPPSPPATGGGLGWRREVLAQRTLANARCLWQRYVAKTRSEVEERMEQLRSFALLSGVLAGFAVASLLQLQYSPASSAAGVVTWFALSAGVTAACATCSMAMCSLVLMSILRTGRGLISEAEEADFLAQCLAFAREYKPGSKPPAPRRSFRGHWESRCEGEWNRAFYLLSLGLASFVVNVMAGAWIKYSPYTSVCISSTAVMAVTLCYLAYAHARWAPYLLSRQAQTLATGASLAPAGLPFDWHQPPERGPLGFARQRRHSATAARRSKALDAGWADAGVTVTGAGVIAPNVGVTAAEAGVTAAEAEPRPGEVRVEVCEEQQWQ